MSSSGDPKEMQMETETCDVSDYNYSISNKMNYVTL